MQFVDFLKTTVLLSAGSATLLAALTVARVAASADYGPMDVAVGWWLLAALIGGWLGRRNAASPPIARLLADARLQTMLPKPPGADAAQPALAALSARRHPRGLHRPGLGRGGRTS